MQSETLEKVLKALLRKQPVTKSRKLAATSIMIQAA